ECNGQTSFAAPRMPSASGPPRCGQVACVAKSWPSRARNTAIHASCALKLRPSPNGIEVGGPKTASIRRITSGDSEHGRELIDGRRCDGFKPWISVGRNTLGDRRVEGGCYLIAVFNYNRP